MSSAIETIAGALRGVTDHRSLQDVLTAHAAEHVDVRHVPPHETDGVITRAEMARRSRDEAGQLDALELSLDGSEVDVRGDDHIHVVTRSSGVFDGEPFHTVTALELKVAGGAITSLVSHLQGR
jgi:hypothetical protein